MEHSAPFLASGPILIMNEIFYQSSSLINTEQGYMLVFWQFELFKVTKCIKYKVEAQ